MKVIRNRPGLFVRIGEVLVKASPRRPCPHCRNRPVEYTIEAPLRMRIQPNQPNPREKEAAAHAQG